MRAINDEGNGEWSPSGTGTTNTHTISIAPVSPSVTEGSPAVFTLTANSAPESGLTVNLTVAAVGEYGVATGPATVTIQASQPTATHTVTTTNDSTDEANGSVTATDDDANTPPTFNDGDNTTRTLAENTAAGQNVGAPLTATDEDGDTLTYSLSGVDAGFFEIVSGTGQLQTKSGVSYNLEAKPAYSVKTNVGPAVSDGNGGHADTPSPWTQ